jgi:hypothetical protein
MTSGTSSSRWNRTRKGPALTWNNRAQNQRQQSTFLGFYAAATRTFKSCKGFNLTRLRHAQANGGGRRSFALRFLTRQVIAFACANELIRAPRVPIPAAGTPSLPWKAFSDGLLHPYPPHRGILELFVQRTAD